MQRVLDNLQSWEISNSMRLHSKKTKDMSFSRSACVPTPLRIDSKIIERVPVFKLLGVWHQSDLRWNHTLGKQRGKPINGCSFSASAGKAILPKEVGISVYCSKLRPLLEYASPVWGGLPKYLADDLQRVQDRSLGIIGLPKSSLPPLEDRRDVAAKRELEKMIKDKNHPNHSLVTLLTNSWATRSMKRVVELKSATNRHRDCFIPMCYPLLNKFYLNIFKTLVNSFELYYSIFNVNTSYILLLRCFIQFSFLICDP